MLHPLALHVPWLKRDKLVFVFPLWRRRKVWVGFETQSEIRFCWESRWKSEKYSGDLRPPGRELKGNGCHFRFPSESSHYVTFSGVLSGFSCKKGWSTLRKPLSNSTTMHILSSETEASMPAFTELAGHFAMYFHVKRISYWFPFLKSDLAEQWTPSNSIKLNAHAQLLTGFGPYAFM